MKSLCAIKRLICIPVAVLVVQGCGSVDPVEDWRDTETLIRERTGAERSFSPAAEEETVKAAVDALIENGITVDEAVTIALLNNPGLKAAFYEIGISRAEVVQAGLPPNPSFSLSNRWPRGGGMSNLTASFSQNITDLFLIPLRKKIAGARLEAKKLEVAHRAVRLAGEVKRLCYEILGLRRAEKVTLENVSLAERSVEIARHRMTAGEADKLEVNMTRSDLLAVKRELVMLRRDRKAAETQLAALLGLGRSGRPWSLEGDFPAPSVLPGEKDLLDRALRRRLDLRLAEKRVLAAEKKLSEARLGVIPHIAVGAEYERAEEPPDLRGPTFDFTFPLWDQNRAEIARARYELSRVRREYEGAVEKAAEEIREALVRARENGRLVVFYENEVLPLAKENVESARRGYTSGGHTILFLTHAQKSLIEERRGYVRALKEYAQAVADLERAVGGRLSAASADGKTGEADGGR